MRRLIAESLTASAAIRKTPGLFKRLEFNGVHPHIFGGIVGHLHVGLKDTMNVLYPKELAEKSGERSAASLN